MYGETFKGRHAAHLQELWRAFPSQWEKQHFYRRLQFISMMSEMGDSAVYSRFHVNIFAMRIQKLLVAWRVKNVLK